MFNSRLVVDPSDGTSKSFSVPVVQELAYQNLHSLPERYIRSEKERPNNSIPYQSDIPIIDMDMFLRDSDLCRQKELEKLGAACQQWGFFQVVNHGIPLSLLERMKGIFREFIQLPLEEKLKYKVQESEGYGQMFVASDDQTLDWADVLYLATLPPENRKMNFWPTKPRDFRETLDRYAVEIQKLDNTVLSLLSENLGLKPDCFINIFGKMSLSTRMNYYPPCPRPDLVLGLSPHSDATGLTVLLQDDETVGLHICKDGEWIPVQPIPGALVINIGDMLEVISNGIFNSIEHRAVTNMDSDRISIAMFCAPSGETEVGPAPELIDELHPCKYRKFIRQEYMQHYFSSRLDGKGSLEFAKIKS
ncbi:oxoglutarate-dependent flavonoid 7-O-demethylase 1 [Cryptomeria japonica]|uniref:oxoglutarate-dependent flavonoid 7-O-demethylase 1 n=1 Tax=Cryptomeria japonica TaxID=3369 RepID=UPI0025AC0661|nr:oxoglutarate-dependent flavonoid 7-O-demethylase 1 [Cryptomeria japonica]